MQTNEIELLSNAVGNDGEINSRYIERISVSALALIIEDQKTPAAAKVAAAKSLLDWLKSNSQSARGRGAGTDPGLQSLAEIEAEIHSLSPTLD